MVAVMLLFRVGLVLRFVAWRKVLVALVAEEVAKGLSLGIESVVGSFVVGARGCGRVCTSDHPSKIC